MNRKFLAAWLALLASAICTPTAAYAQDGAWRITSSSGIVRLREPGAAPRNAQVNQPLNVGTVVTTGGESSATLQNGAQRIVMSANSRMTIAPASMSGMTRILQDLGSLFFEVDRREVQHFQVETPRLAAIVKGTSFTVSVGDASDLVSVASGLVEVRALQGGAFEMAGAGDAVRIFAAAPQRLVREGRNAPRSSSGELELRNGYADVSTRDAGDEAWNLPDVPAPNFNLEADNSGGLSLDGATSPANWRGPSSEEAGSLSFIVKFLLAAFGFGFGFFIAVQVSKVLTEVLFGSKKKKAKQRKPANDETDPNSAGETNLNPIEAVRARLKRSA